MSNLLIIAATNNAHKLVEFKEIFSQAAEAQTEVMSLKDAVRIYAGDAAEYGDPEETGKTFAANAYLKAAALYEFVGKALQEEQKKDTLSDVLIVADDSGLCVNALDGAPGVYSARYASQNGENATDSQNVEKLLDVMKDVPDDERQASFVCAVTGILLKPGLKEFVLLMAEGHMPGVIARETRGSNGFGYDPVLFLPEYGKSVAELTPDEKNDISHRGQALRRLADRYYGLRKEL